ncbi:DMT family transporter [Haloprofundus halophilus]|uniref:DMT family transporter n=1 Tax=Haloprofundus halophilus TaxID=2283527 RepID=UPI000E445490|nr:EamA family transporter [Haloprofundus halophilus]
MTSGISYSLVAAVVWGVYLFVLKRYFDGIPGSVLTVLVNVAAIAWYVPVLLTSVSPSETPSFASLGVEALGVLVGTICATGAAFLIFLRALDAGDVSYVAPINKVVPVFVLPIEILLLHERLAPIQMLGVVVATLAVYVANYRGGRLADPIRAASSSTAAQLALLSAACYAVSDVGKRVVLQELSLQPQLWVVVLLGGVTVVVLPFAVRSWSDGALTRRTLGELVVGGFLVALGEHVTSLAFAAVPASIASPIINTQAVVAVVLGGVLLREEFFGTRLVAAALAVFGVGLIALDSGTFGAALGWF